MTQPNEQLRNAAHRLTHPTPDPVYVPQPSRPARIAALHAGALFIAQESHLPVPVKAEMAAWHVHYGELAALADHYGVEIERGATATWITIPISVAALHGVEISYTLYADVATMPMTTPMDTPARGEGLTYDNTRGF